MKLKLIDRCKKAEEEREEKQEKHGFEDGVILGKGASLDRGILWCIDFWFFFLMDLFHVNRLQYN